jgi:hypothetical protein
LSLVSLTIFWFNVVDILLATSPLFVFKSAIGFEEKIASLPGLLGRVWFHSPAAERRSIRLHFVFGCWNETELLHLHWFQNEAKYEHWFWYIFF